PQANVAMALASPGLADTLKYFRRAIELDPSNADAYHLIGGVLSDIDPERAAAFFTTSLALDPRQDMVRVHLAQSLLVLDRDEDVRAELKKIPAIAGAAAGISTAVLAMNDVRHERYSQAVAGFASI